MATLWPHIVFTSVDLPADGRPATVIKADFITHRIMGIIRKCKDKKRPPFQAALIGIAMGDTISVDLDGLRHSLLHLWNLKLKQSVLESSLDLLCIYVVRQCEGS